MVCLARAERERALKSRMRVRAPPAAAARRAVIEFKALSRTIACEQSMPAADAQSRSAVMRMTVRFWRTQFAASLGWGLVSAQGPDPALITLYPVGSLAGP